MANIVEQKVDKALQKEKQAQPRKSKTSDKWKKKAWYTIIAPEEFEGKELGETISEKPDSLRGRVVLISGRELANQPKKQHVKIKFKIKKVSGNKAYTDAVGHIIKDDFIRRLVRRRSSKVMSVSTCTTKDGKAVRVKTVIVTDRKASGRQKTSIKKKSEDEVKKIVGELDSRKIVDEFVFGTIPNKLYPKLKKILPIKRIEIASSAILETGG